MQLFFPSGLQDDLGTLSDAKTFAGDLVVGLYNEDILPDYTIRTMKVISPWTMFAGLFLE